MAKNTCFIVYGWKERPSFLDEGGWLSEASLLSATCFSEVFGNNEADALEYLVVNELEYNYFTPYSYILPGGRRSEVKMKKLYQVNEITGKCDVLEEKYTVVPRRQRIRKERRSG